MTDLTVEPAGSVGPVEPAAARSLAPAVDRAAAVLDLLSRSRGEAVGPSEIARRLGAPKSSVANICRALLAANLVQRRSDGYVLGRKIVELARGYLDEQDSVQAFHAVGREVSLPDTLQLAVAGDGLGVLFLARRDGNRPTRLASDIGRQLPANCTAVGKALFAGFDDEELERRLAGVTELPALTANSIRDVDRFRAELAAVRARGYAIDDEETTEGVLCVGVRIPLEVAASGAAAVSLTALKAQAPPERTGAMARDLTAIATEIGRRVGLGLRR